VDGVVDIIVKRRESGYGMMMNVLQSVNRGWGNYVGALKYTTGRSEWTVEYNSNPMWNMDCYRNNVEQFILSDGSVIRRYECGIKAPNRMVTHHASLQYSYAEGSKVLFNVQGRLTRRNDKYVSTGEITTEMSDVISMGYEKEIAPIKTWQGDIDFYLYYKLNKRHKLYFNLVSSIVNGRNERWYQTDGNDIESSIVTEGYHLLGEGIWEGKIGTGVITSGFRINRGWNNASYLVGDYRVNEIESAGQLFAEWKQRVNKLNYSVEFESSLYSVCKPVRYTKVFVNPRLSINYTPFVGGTLSISLSSITINPTINQLNPVTQRVDLFQWSKGNVELTPFQRFELKTGFDATFKGIAAKITLSDKYYRNPIMGIKRYDDNRIVCSYINGGHNNDFEVRASLRIPILDRKLTCSVEGGWHTTISQNQDYKHTYSQPFVNLQLMYMMGRCWIMATYNNAYNQLWGETISTINRNLLNFGVGYTYRMATFSVGVVNPFGNVALKTKDLSEIASFDRTYQASGSHLLVWTGVSMNLHKGKRRAAIKKRMDNKAIYESIKNQMK
ncbi:MAG: outer membrane beta-barrel family protein, partial [Muribaculaceae bacterium]|nr:outer membrane beta-barrel family protein [Muribaculaceae bacterium]